MSFFLLFLLLFFQTSWIFAWEGSQFFPYKCHNFSDNRTDKKMHQEYKNSPVLTIPARLTSKGDTTIEFILSEWNDSDFSSKGYEYRCSPLSQTEIMWVNLTKIGNENDDDYDLENIVPPTITHPDLVRDIEQIRSSNQFFTADGYFYENGHFYSPADYCIYSVSDEELILKRCQLDCLADLSNTDLYTTSPNGHSSSRICIPKCCDVDETLSSFSTNNNLKCRRLNDNEPLYFFPYLRFPKPVWYLVDSNKKDLDKYSYLIKFAHALDKRGTYNSTTGLGLGNRDIWNRIHFFSPGNVTCENGFIKETFKISEIIEGKNGLRRPFRLSVTPKIQPQYLTRSRQWQRHNSGEQFCIDGLDKWGDTPLENDIALVVMMCSSKPMQNSLRNVVNIAPITFEDWIHLGFSIFAIILLLLTFLTFLLLFKTLNIQEKMILSHCTSISALYIFATLGRLYYLLSFDDKTTTAGNAPVTHYGNAGDIMKDGENTRIGTGCMIIAVLHHYFQFTTYFWLTVMNYDLWQRMAYYFVKGQRKIGEMSFYSLFAWGTPALLILSFIIVDHYNSDPFITNIVVPDYAKEYCTVGSWSAGYYLYLPLAIILVINLIFILNRMDKWCRKKCIEDGGNDDFAFRSILRRRESLNVPCDQKISAFPSILFTIIYFIHTVAWLFEFVNWLKLFRNNYQSHWAVPVTQYISLLGVPLLLCYLYCMNDATLQRIANNYPVLNGVTSALRNSKLVLKKSGFLKNDDKCTNPGNEIDNDTVVIESAEAR